MVTMETTILLKIVHVKRLTTRQARISKNQASQWCIICPFCLKERKDHQNAHAIPLLTYTRPEGSLDYIRNGSKSSIGARNNTSNTNIEHLL